MTSREEYLKAKEVVESYLSQLKNEVDMIEKMFCSQQNADYQISYFSKIKKGDKCKVLSIERYTPSLSVGDICEVNSVSHQYKNGTHKFFVSLKRANGLKTDIWVSIRREPEYIDMSNIRFSVLIGDV